MDGLDSGNAQTGLPDKGMRDCPEGSAPKRPTPTRLEGRPSRGHPCCRGPRLFKPGRESFLFSKGPRGRFFGPPGPRGPKLGAPGAGKAGPAGACQPLPGKTDRASPHAWRTNFFDFCSFLFSGRGPRRGKKPEEGPPPNGKTGRTWGREKILLQGALGI